MTPVLTERRVRSLAWLVMTALLMYFALMLVRYPPVFLGVDMAVWQHDWEKLQCQLSGAVCEGLEKFPFAYLMMSALLEAIKPLTTAALVSFSGVVHPLAGAALGISVLNSLFLLLPVGFFWCVDRPTWRWRSFTYAMAISASPVLPFYVASGGLELQAGVLLGLCIASTQRIVIMGDQRLRVISLLFITVLLTPLYKDTNLPVIGFALLLLLIEGWRSARCPLAAYLSNMRWPLCAVIVAGLFSLAIIFAYNYQKYSSIFPLGYIHEAEYSHQSLSMVLWNLQSVLLSPNGGALVFWTFSIAILICCAWLLRARIPALALKLCATIFGLSVLISANWWSPFGWDGWGNRLLVAGMLAVIIVLVSALEIRATPAAGPDGAARSGNSLARAMAGFILLLVCTFSGAYVFVSYSGNRTAYLHDSLSGPESCKRMYERRASMDTLSFMTARLYEDCHADRFLWVPALFVPNVPALSTSPSLGSPPVLSPGITLDIPRDKPKKLLRDGWSDIESWGVWSSGHKAQLAFVPSASLQKVVLTLTPLTASTLTAQRVRVYLNGRFVREVSLAQTSTLEIPVVNGAEYNGEKMLELELELPDAAQPFRLGINEDQRTLGVGLKVLEVR